VLKVRDKTRHEARGHGHTRSSNGDGPDGTRRGRRGRSPQAHEGELQRSEDSSSGLDTGRNTKSTRVNRRRQGLECAAAGDRHKKEGGW